jgi:response regulator RpfG family c-di-GMP phosphodiesterase
MNRWNVRHVVICVDDESLVLEALRRTLHSEPYQVLTTNQPEEALEWLGKREVSLVISDQRMPGMQGTDLLDEVERRSPTTGRVILTAYGGPTAATPGIGRHIDCMISKPWDGPMLRKAIRTLLLERDLVSLEDHARLNE